MFNRLIGLARALAHANPFTRANAVALTDADSDTQPQRDPYPDSLADSVAEPECICDPGLVFYGCPACDPDAARD